MKKQSQKGMYLLGIIISIILILFGTMVSMSSLLDGYSLQNAFGSLILTIFGLMLLTLLLLITETKKSYSMGKLAASGYSIAIGLILFSVFVGVSSGMAMNSFGIAISSGMLFFIVGVALLIALILGVGWKKRKNKTEEE